ncbi:hypothetical protein OSTOST_14270 [Ostertagia ostertagi]
MSNRSKGSPGWEEGQSATGFGRRLGAEAHQLAGFEDAPFVAHVRRFEQHAALQDAHAVEFLGLVDQDAAEQPYRRGGRADQRHVARRIASPLRTDDHVRRQAVALCAMADDEEVVGHWPRRLHRRLDARIADGLLRQRGRHDLRREQGARREAATNDRRLCFLSRLRHVRRPPARDRRPGDEVHQEPAGALGKPEMASLCEWPGAHQKPVMDFLAETFRAKSLAHWMDYLATLDICYGPVNTLPEAIADANLQKRGFMVTDDDGRLHFGPVVRFKDEPSSPLYREPLLGEHTDEVLKR